MSQFNFHDLNPDVILDAMETVGIRAESGLLALNSYENRVYQFVAEGEKRLVTKFYRPNRWTKEQIQEEHAFAQELSQHEIPVVAPLSIKGNSVFEHEGYMFALFPSVGGRQFEVDNYDQLEWMGRFIGRIHKVSASASFHCRPSLSQGSHIDDPIETLKTSTLIPAHLHVSFFTILEQVSQLAREQYQPTSSIRLHGDLHPGNILWRDGPSFVDLDDCRSGPAIQDIWMMLSGDRAQQQIQLDVLYEAYEEFEKFPKEQLPLIEPLRTMRMIHYMAWLSNRWQDPAFPRAFPWFAEGKYWEQQILALKEQFSALQEPPITLLGL